MVGTVPDTAAAVHAELGLDGSLSAVYPDGLGGTVFDTVDAACAGIFIQFDRMYEFIQKMSSFTGQIRLQVYVHGPLCPHTHLSVDLHIV